MGSGSTPGNRCRSTAGKAGLATVAVLAGMAAAVPSGALASTNPWYLTVRPTQITPGGTVTIKTTAHRRCALTIRVAGTNYYYRLPRGGERFTFASSTPLGKTPVTVHRNGLAATIKLRVVAPPATQPGPTAPPASTPPSTPAPAPTQTPITVANVCGLNPALGPIHYTTTSEGYPTASRTDGTGSKLTLMAFSDDGDNKLDIAAVFGADGQSVAYFAHCDWSSWLTVAQFEAA